MIEPVLAREIFERLRQTTAKNPEVLTELCRDYLLEARSTLAHVREAIVQGDAGQLRERAHYLRGSSMMIGARELSVCCAMLEQMGRDSKLANAEAQLASAVAALKAVEDELAREFGPCVLPGEGSAA